MERFNRANPGAVQSSSSSVYSTDSLKETVDSAYSASTASVHSRTAPTAPSYMRATVPPRKPVTPRLAPSANGKFEKRTTFAERKPFPKGILLLAVGGSSHPSTVSYIEMMLKRGSYKEVMIVGYTGHEEELKRLKIDIYALLGKLGKEIGVTVISQEHWTPVDFANAVTKAVEGGDAVHGVLCSPAYEETHDVLSADEKDLELSWRSSIGFIHRVAKATTPHFRSDRIAQTGIDPVQAGTSDVFLVTSPPRKASFALNQAACDTLLRMLAETTAAKAISVDYADNILIPEPEGVDINGEAQPVGNEHLGFDPTFTPGESPTKLWNMWALQEQLDVAD